MESELTFSYAEFELIDYHLVESWCAAHDRTPPRLDCLPSRGVIVLADDEPIAMLFLFVDVTCDVGIVDWAISRPRLTAEEARQALIYAIDGPISDLAREAGCTVLTCYTLMGLARSTKRAGWAVEHREMANLTKAL
jgi:hypothetical protein